MKPTSAILPQTSQPKKKVKPVMHTPALRPFNKIRFKPRAKDEPATTTTPTVTTAAAWGTGTTIQTILPDEANTAPPMETEETDEVHLVFPSSYPGSFAQMQSY